jgi:hypothetical protein
MAQVMREGHTTLDSMTVDKIDRGSNLVKRLPDGSIEL